MPSVREDKNLNVGGPAASARPRVSCYEWLRACGCVAIVLLHVFVSLDNAVGYWALGYARSMVEAVVGITLARWAVPCFLMVTGALLLDPAKDVGWVRIWRYAQRMLFVLGTFGLAFCLIESVVTHGGASLAVVGEALLNVVSGRSWGHLWYVYALLGLYVLTPALRSIVAGLGPRRLAWLLAGLYAVVLVVPTAAWLGWGVTLATPVNLAPTVFYYLLGWYVHSCVKLDGRVVLAGAASLAAMIDAAFWGYGWLCLPEYCLVAPYGVLVFCCFERFATAPVESSRMGALLADHSFGIYVVHPLFLHVITRVIDPLSIPWGLYELGAFTVALVGSIVLVDLVRRIPGFAGRI